MKKTNKIILLVGLSQGSQLYVDYLKNKAYTLIGVGKENFVNKIDQYIPCSTFELEDSFEHITNTLHKETKISGVFSRTSGPALKLHQKLAFHFRVPSPSKEFILASISLEALYQLMRRLGIRSPKGAIISNKNVETLEYIKRDYTFPFIMKPDISIIGKSFVKLVSTENEFYELFYIVSKNSYNRKVSIERYLPGREYQVFLIASLGKIIMYKILENDTVLDSNGLFVGGYKNFQGSKNLKVKMLEISKLIVNSYFSSGTHVITFRDTAFDNLIVTELGYGLGGDGMYEEGWLNENWLDCECSILLGA